MEYFSISTGELFAWVQIVENRVIGKIKDFIFIWHVSCTKSDKIYSKLQMFQSMCPEIRRTF
jgi:hypothetical protein